MKKMLMMLGLVAMTACASKSGGSVPVISDLTVTTPVAAGSTTLSGSLQVTDPSGLAGLTLNITLSGGGTSSTLSQAVENATSSVTTATVPVTIILEGAPPAGTYQVTVTADEGGGDSNSLSATLTIQ
jgi:hypothetical protein